MFNNIYIVVFKKLYKNRLMVDLFKEHASGPYNNMGIRLVETSFKIISLKIILRSIPTCMCSRSYVHF